MKTLLVTSLATSTLISGVVPFVAPDAELKASASVAVAAAQQPQQSADPCSQQAWPYYQGDCVRDGRQPTGRGTNVRFVSADRFPAAR